MERDVKRFETTILKDSRELKELKDSELELAQFKVDMDKARTLEQLEPVQRNLVYLEHWEPEWFRRMEKMLPPVSFL